MFHRRDLLKGAVALGLGQATSRLAFAAPGSPEQNTLVCVFLRGGVDGLSMVVPYHDPDYYKARPGIAIPKPGTRKGAAIKLDRRFGLHPAMESLQPLFQRKKLAVIHAVGSPHETRSHFDAQDYMESGVLGRARSDGWLNRCLSRQASPLQGVALSGDLPLMLRGPSPTIAMSGMDKFGLRARKMPLEKAFGSLYEQGQTAGAKAGRDALEVVRRVKVLSKKTPAAKGYPKGATGARFADVARLIKSDASLRCAAIDVGGFDTHTGQGNGERGRLKNALEPLAKSMRAFDEDLGSRMERVVVLVMSEFGRTAHQNGSGGTDHGHGTAMMVMGGGVRGGRVYGKWPGLAKDKLHQGRDLEVTTDFRDLFSEVVSTHLGVSDMGKIFPGYSAGKALGVMG